MKNLLASKKNENERREKGNNWVNKELMKALHSIYQPATTGWHNELLDVSEGFGVVKKREKFIPIWKKSWYNMEKVKVVIFPFEKDWREKNKSKLYEEKKIVCYRKAAMHI